MICFLVMGFGLPEHKTESLMSDSDHLLTAIVYAEDREDCKHVLRSKLIRMNGLRFITPDEWVITPLTPEPKDKYATVIDPHRKNIRT